MAVMSAGFLPECLTVFCSNKCNLACRYCHASPVTAAGPPISDRVLADAADIVAASCARRGVAMTFALLGGGEPLLDRDDAARILGILRERAAAAGVPLRTYVATNGVVPEETARWAAAEFDLIGLSCDGPPAVQDAQRPARGGGPSSPHVERSAAALRESGRPFHVRATVTAESLGMQSDVVAYTAGTLGAAEVRLEPVYANPGATVALTADDADAFCDGFLVARRAGAELGVPVTTSLMRPNEPHGPHCNVLRGVVDLTPDGIATGCFLESRAEGIDARRVRMGGAHPVTGRFELDSARIAELAAACGHVPEECRDCPLEHACSRGCPDICMLGTGSGAPHRGTFRCRAQLRLAAEAVLA
jgi:sulfatase maturation enzyme AslB (radical SAM superfamily)